jgi:hypothetical protein
MIDDFHLLMIPSLTLLLLPLAAAVSVFDLANRDESVFRPRISLPQNVPYIRREDTNSSVLNNVTSNVTSGSQSIIWIIQDTYDASNFFE